MQPSPQDLQNMMERARLQEDLISSDAWKLRSRLRTFDLSLEVFKRNYSELDAALEAHKPKKVAEVFRFAQDHHLRQEQLIELTRVFHNFVASASSLIDTARVFYNEVYEPKKLMPEYADEISKRFLKDGLCRLVVALRQLCLHVELPLIVTSLGIDVEKQEIRNSVSLKREDILKHKDIAKGIPKEYREALPERINIQEEMAAYYQKITDFYNWFAERQREIHKEELGYIERTRVKIVELGGGGSLEAGERTQPLISPVEFSRSQIELVAYYIYVDEGKKDGRDKIHWNMAIQRLAELKDRSGPQIV